MNGEPENEPSIRDIVLFEDGGDRHDARKTSSPPIRERVDVGGDVHIERLPAELNRKIKNACAFRGHNWEIQMDTLPTLYAFVQNSPDDGRWDERQHLQIAIALSRLCNPTSIGLEFAVRVYAPGVRHKTDYVIEPALIAGHGTQAFIPDPGGRNWLSRDDVADLPAITAAFGGAQSEFAARHGSTNTPLALSTFRFGWHLLPQALKHWFTWSARGRLASLLWVPLVWPRIAA